MIPEEDMIVRYKDVLKSRQMNPYYPSRTIWVADVWKKIKQLQKIIDKVKR